MKREFEKFNKIESPKTFCKASVFGLQVLLVQCLTTKMRLGIPTKLFVGVAKYIDALFITNFFCENNILSSSDFSSLVNFSFSVILFCEFVFIHNDKCSPQSIDKD